MRPPAEKGKDLAGLIDIVNKRAGPGWGVWLKVAPPCMMRKHFLPRARCCSVFVLYAVLKEEDADRRLPSKPLRYRHSRKTARASGLCLRR